MLVLPSFRYMSQSKVHESIGNIPNLLASPCPLEAAEPIELPLFALPGKSKKDEQVFETLNGKQDSAAPKAYCTAETYCNDPVQDSLPIPDRKLSYQINKSADHTWPTI